MIYYEYEHIVHIANYLQKQRTVQQISLFFRAPFTVHEIKTWMIYNEFVVDYRSSTLLNSFM